MDKQSFMQMAKTINCDYEIGIWSETHDFLKRQKKVKAYELKYNEDHFSLSIILKDFDLSEVKAAFHQFLVFIEYNATYYFREDNLDSFTYYLLSSMDSKKGFVMHISFTSSKELK